MSKVSYATALDRFASIWNETLATREPVIISRRGWEPVVLVAQREWEGLLETVHLLSSPANASRLMGALKRLSDGSLPSIPE
jgi:antitoxin YefM